MENALKPGIIGKAIVSVTPDNTAEKFGNFGAAVFATPMLVALMEQAAINALAPYLADGQGSVGTKVEITHTAAMPIGMSVQATCSGRMHWCRASSKECWPRRDRSLYAGTHGCVTGAN